MNKEKNKIAVYGTLRRGEGKLGRIENTSLVYPGHQTFPAIIQNSKGKGTVVEVRDITEEKKGVSHVVDAVDAEFEEEDESAD